MMGRQKLVRRLSKLLEAAEFLLKELDRRYNTTYVVGLVMFGGHLYRIVATVMAGNGAFNATNMSRIMLYDLEMGKRYGMLPPNGVTSRILKVTFINEE